MKRTAKSELTRSPKREETKTPSSQFQPVFKKTLDRYLPFVLVLVLLLMSFFSFYDFFVLKKVFLFTGIGSDSVNQNYPYIYHNQLLRKEGLFSVYSFYIGLGEQYYTSPTLFLYPVSLFFFLLNSLVVNLFGHETLVYLRFFEIYLFYIIFSGIVFYYYLRTIACKRYTAFIGALLVTFSGYMVIGSSWGFCSVIAAAVFLLFSFEQLYLKKRPYFLPFAIMFLGNIYAIYIYGLFLLIYSLFRYAADNERLGRGYLKLAFQLALWTFVSLLIHSNMAIVNFLKMLFSPRGSGSTSYAADLSEHSSWLPEDGLGATGIMRFFSGDMLGGGLQFRGWGNYFEAPAFYIGLITLLLVPQVFTMLSKRKKIVYGVFLAFWISTFIFPKIRLAYLLYTGDYFRQGFDFFIPFAFLFVALQVLNFLTENVKINLPLLLGTLAILLFFLFFPYSSLPQDAIRQDLRIKVLVFLLLYTGILILFNFYREYAKIALVLLLVAELSYFAHQSFSEREAISRVEFDRTNAGYKDGTRDAVKYLKSADKSQFYRIEKDYRSGSAVHGSLNDGMAQGYYGTSQYLSFNQLNYVKFLEKIGLIQPGDESASRWITGLKNYPLLQTFASVKYHFSKSKNPAFENFGFDRMSEISGIKILKNRFALPFGYTYDSYISASDFESLMRYRLNPKTLNNLRKDLIIIGLEAVEAEEIIQRIRSLSGKDYRKKTAFENDLKGILSQDVYNRTRKVIVSAAVDNFRMQTALLGAFVPKNDSAAHLNNYRQITPGDTAVITAAENFNFEKYERLVKNLKEDTFVITKFKQNHIEGNISVSSAKMLFFSLPYDEAWRLRVNGKKANLQLVNWGFSGVELPAGNHHISLIYKPLYSGISFYFSYFFFLLFLIYIIYDIRKKRKNKSF